MLVLQIIFSIVLADIIATIVHWFEDTYIHFCTRNKLLRDIADDNELHHYYPHYITSISYFDNCHATLILITILYILLLTFFYKHLKKYIAFWIVLGLTFIFIVCNHRLVHERDCNKNEFIKFIHDFLIVGSNIHNKHHEQPSTQYSVLLQPINVLFDELHIFRILENIIFTLTGIKPRHKNEYKDYPKTEFHKQVEMSHCPNKIKKEEAELLLQNVTHFYHLCDN